MFCKSKQVLQRSFTGAPNRILLTALGFWLVGSFATVEARQGTLNDPAYFDKLKKQAAELQRQADELNRKIAAAAQPHLDAQAKALGGADKARTTAGASLAEINERLAARAVEPSAGGSRTDPIIEPGMKMAVLLKNPSRHYTGTLVGVKDRKLLLQTIPDSGAHPSEFDLNNIAAFQIKKGIYAYNPKAGKIVLALTCYRFNKATGTFDRMDGIPSDTFLAEKAKIVGPTKSTPAFFDASLGGTWGVGLPIPFDMSPKTIPAASFLKVITAEGVHTYDAQTKGYTYKSHADFAKEAQEQKDEAGKKYYKDQWDRDTQQYQLETNRIEAWQPDFSWGWTGGAPPWYVPQQPPR
jgi:hypothetical protein